MKSRTAAGQRLLMVALAAVLILGLSGLAVAADRLVIKNDSGDVTAKISDAGAFWINAKNPGSIAPYAKIYAADDGMVGFVFEAFNDRNDGGAGVVGHCARGSQSSPAAVQEGDRLGFFVFGGYDGSGFQHPAGLTCKVDGPVSGGSVPAKFIFETGTSNPRNQSMVISSSGNVGIGIGNNNNPTHLLEVGTSGAHCDGGSWVDGSSREFKTDIHELNSSAAMAAFKQLKPVTFKYKAVPDDEHVGFIAEDVPDLVATANRKGMSAMDIVAVLTRVVQEQQKMIDDLKNKVEAMQ